MTTPTPKKLNNHKGNNHKGITLIKPMKPLAIIGLDPGTTSAYAILDLQGNLLHHYAAKELTLSEMILQITEVCFPLIVSTDKAKTPSFVEEFARKMGTELVTPPEDMKREEKRIMLLAKDVHYNGAHEQDAAAAALFAYQRYLPKFKKIDRFIQEHQLESHRAEFTRIAVHEDLHFSMIHEILTKPSVESQVMQRAVLQNRITKKDFLALYAKLNQLRAEKQQLERSMQEMREKNSLLAKEKGMLSRKSTDFDRKVDTLFKFKEERLKLQAEELKQQEEIIAHLQQKIKQLHQFIEKSSGLQLVKKIATLGAKEFEDAHSLINIRHGDVLLVENPEIYSEKVVQMLQEQGIMVLSHRKGSKFISSTFISAHTKPEDLIMENEHFALIDKTFLEEKFDRKAMVEKIVKEYQEDRNV